MKSVLYIVLTVILAFSICGEAAGQHKNFILVIDPGHGGEDPGAVHGRFQEKELNLEVALALGALIRREMPGVDVLYTRTDDSAVGLAARGDFANRAGADLFLSIHTNANRSSSPGGSETYVMGMDKNEANLEVAKLENEVIKYEDDYSTTYAGFDAGSTEMSIIFGMLQYAHFESSLQFARLVQKHFTAHTPIKDRGAKQGPFAVLWKPTMPRVLTEIGFISNDSDRKYIFSDKGKTAIVRALFEAFREYRESVVEDSPAPTPTPVPAPVQTTATPPATTAPTAPTAPAATTPAPVTANATQTTAQTTATTSTPAATPPVTATQSPAPARLFYVQLAAARGRVSTSDSSWGAYRGMVVEKVIDGWYKYSLGPFSTREEAAAKLDEVRRGKYPGAFIVEAETNQKK